MGIHSLTLINSCTWLITSELANQRAPKVLFTCVVYTPKGGKLAFQAFNFYRFKPFYTFLNDFEIFDPFNFFPCYLVSLISLLVNLLRNTRFNLRLIFIRHLNFVCPDKVGAVNHFQFHRFALNFTLLPSNAEILACILLPTVTVTVVDQR